MARPRLSLFPGIALGSVIGAATSAALVWFFTCPAPPAPIINHKSSTINNWSWRDSATPPRLPDQASASAALAAWRALRAPDGGPADFATRAAALRALLLRLPSATYPRLLEQLLASEKSPDAESLRQIAFHAWLELDPAAATRWAGARPELRDLLRTALDAWSAADPRAAAAWACALPDLKLAAKLADSLLPTLAETDPQAAIALASTRGEAFLKKLLPSLLRVLARHDPVATVQTYGPLVWDGGEGLGLLLGPLGSWADRDPAAALAWIFAQPTHRDLFDNLGYIEIKPGSRPAFAQALLETPRLAHLHRSLGLFLVQWANDDSTSAAAWVEKIPDTQARLSLLDHALGLGGATRRMLPFALALPAGHNRQQRLANILDQWAQNSPAEALSWIEAHSNDPGVVAASAYAQSAMLGVIARDDPAAAIAEWQKLPEGVAKYQGRSAIVSAWGRVDPAAALQWQVAQDPKFLIHDRSQGLIFQWARRDATAALRWAEALPPDTRSFALTHLVTDRLGNHTPPAAAADLYAQIQDPALRVEFVTAQVRDWLGKDRAAAQAWLETHGALSPGQTAVLLAP